MNKKKIISLILLNLCLLMMIQSSRAIEVYHQPDDVNDVYLIDKTTITKVYSSSTGSDCIDIVDVEARVESSNLTTIKIKVDSFLTNEYCPQWDFRFFFVRNLDNVYAVTKIQNMLSYAEHVALVYYDEVNGGIKGKYQNRALEDWGVNGTIPQEFNVTIDHLSGEGRSVISFDVYEAIEEDDYGVVSYQKLDDNVKTYALDSSPNSLISIEEEDIWNPLQMGETIVLIAIIVFMMGIAIIMLFRSLKKSEVIGKPSSSKKRRQ